MKLSKEKLIKGKILKRYKRFLADVELTENHNGHNAGDVITAHTANTGSMTTCWEPGWKVVLSFHDNPKRKLKYSLEMIHNKKTWIGVNTSLPNKLAVEAIKNKTILELSEYESIRPEIKIGNSRLDLLLYDGDQSSPSKSCYVEIKNVTLKGDSIGDKDYVLFPDGVSERGQKHLRELTEISKSGIRACMLYIVQREDVNIFSPAEHIDPEYARLLKVAMLSGVEVLVYQCKLTPTKITVIKKIPYKV